MYMNYIYTVCISTKGFVILYVYDYELCNSLVILFVWYSIYCRYLDSIANVMEQVKLLNHHGFIQQLFAVVMTTTPPSSSATSAAQPKKG